MYFRVAPQAESDLDEIWYFLAVQSSNIGIADRVIDSITARFARKQSRDSERVAHAIGSNWVAAQVGRSPCELRVFARRSDGFACSRPVPREADI